MNTSSRLFATLVSAAAALSLAGCALSDTPTATPPYRQVVTSSTLPPPPPPPSSTGSVQGIDSSISASDSGPIKPGGDPFEFTVTLTNTTSADIADVELVLALGHCTCAPSPGAAMMPTGSMRMLDPTTSTWVDVPYDREGTGMDYYYQNLVPPFVIKAGQTLTFRLQMRIDPNPDLIAGGSMINVIVKTPAEAGRGGSLPITVEP